jgi:hypothetical protein
LVIFAVIGGIPRATRTGKLIRVPPPATELIRPAANAAKNANTSIIKYQTYWIVIQVSNAERPFRIT